MGLTLQEARDVMKYLPSSGGTMLELGAQYLNGQSDHKFSQDWFESKGVKVRSLDWNGEGRAEQVDLAEPFDLGEYDVVTNFGTTEHVSNQRTVFKNIHDACRHFGYMVHVVPATGGQKPRHGAKYGFVLKYAERFFPDLAKDNGYRVEKLEKVGWLWHCVLEKSHPEPFVWRN